MRLTRRRLACGLLVAGALLAGCTAHRHEPRPPATATQAALPSPASSATTAPPFAGPDGMQARWVIDENQRPGTTAWRVARYSGAQMAGYAATTAASTGDEGTLYVDTAAPAFHVEAHRMGYYDGTGARLFRHARRVTSAPSPRTSCACSAPGPPG
jgi:hypothetical protein